jgi:hypothetical protein
MKWTIRGDIHRCGGYSIFKVTRGYEVWLKNDTGLSCIAREIPTLDKAKDFCISHEDMMRVREKA